MCLIQVEAHLTYCLIFSFFVTLFCSQTNLTTYLNVLLVPKYIFVFEKKQMYQKLPNSKHPN